MEPPPLPEPPPPARFRLHWLAWSIWGLYAVIVVGFALARLDSANAYSVGFAAGEVIGALVIPTLLAYLVWRLAKRSSTAGTVAFLVVLAVIALGNAATFARRAQARADLSKLATELKEADARQQAAVRRGESVDPAKADAIGQTASSRLAEVASNTSGVERALAEGAKEYMDNLLARKHRYDVAVQKIQAADIWNLSNFSPGTVAERRKEVREMMAANEAWGAYMDAEGREMAHVLAAHQVPARTVSQAVAGYLSSAGPRLPAIAKIRGIDAQLGQAMLEFLDFAESNQRKWRKDSDGKFLFQYEATAKAYNELVHRVQALGAEQAEYQRQAAGVPSR